MTPIAARALRSVLGARRGFTPFVGHDLLAVSGIHQRVVDGGPPLDPFLSLRLGLGKRAFPVVGLSIWEHRGSPPPVGHLAYKAERGSAPLREPGSSGDAWRFPDDGHS